MDIKILHSWLSQYLQTDAEPLEIGRRLALCGPSVEKVEKWGDKDYLYSIEVTTNRIDMMSVYGIAREASVILPQFGHTTKLKPLDLSKQVFNGKSLPLTIKTDPTLTSRVMAQILKIDEIPQTPSWMKDRLEAADIRSINLLVDITNYVMLEVGHPTHIFDYQRITTHKMVFRPSKKGETVTTLDEKTYILNGGDSVIDDGTGTIIDLPGIMGTANSVVNDDSKIVIFFIDNNNPKLMRQTSMQHGIRTNAVTLNEKHVSPELADLAMKRGIQLYQQLCGAKLAAKLIDIYDNKPKSKSIEISLQFVEERLGVKLDPKVVTKTLESLGFKVTLNKKGSKSLSTHNLLLTIPYWRSHDISIPEDIVEEVARIYGYHNLPSILPTGELPKPNPQREQFKWEQRIKNALKYWGFFESYSYSLVSKDLIQPYELDLKDHLKLKNPLTTDWEYLRTSLIPSLLAIVELNQNKTKQLYVFELANTYKPTDNELPIQSLSLTLIQTNSSFEHLKGIIEALCEELGMPVEFQTTEKLHWLEQSIAVNIIINKEKIGFLGQLKDIFQNRAKIQNKTFLANIDFEKLIKHANKNKSYTSIPKYPPILEQYTFINDARVTASQMIAAAKSIDKIIHKVEIIGVFENKISIQVTYLDIHKNLSDQEVGKLRKMIVSVIEKLGMRLQGTI